jgi:hypothetical protein
MYQTLIIFYKFQGKLIREYYILHGNHMYFNLLPTCVYLVAFIPIPTWQGLRCHATLVKKIIFKIFYFFFPHRKISLYIYIANIIWSLQKVPKNS